MPCSPSRSSATRAIAEQQLAVERDLALDDALGDRQHELHHLPLGAVDHFAAQRRRAPRWSGRAGAASLGAGGGRLEAGPLALRVALGERVALDRGGVELIGAMPAPCDRHVDGQRRPATGLARRSAPSENGWTAAPFAASTRRALNDIGFARGGAGDDQPFLFELAGNRHDFLLRLLDFAQADRRRARPSLP